jgi:mono/diheme cytochrome c family protein
VEAAQRRKKVPWWAAAALAALPLFFILYAWTLGEPSNDAGPLAMGNELYNGSAGCAGCHGAGGGGGAGPAMAGGVVVENFPLPVEQVTWVALGSTGYQDAGLSTYGETAQPIQGGMPGQISTLDPSEIMEVVLHERVEFGGEDFDPAVWEEGFEEQINELLPDQAEEFMTILEEWSATPPTG